MRTTRKMLAWHTQRKIAKGLRKLTLKFQGIGVAYEASAHVADAAAAAFAALDAIAVRALVKRESEVTP